MLLLYTTGGPKGREFPFGGHAIWLDGSSGLTEYLLRRKSMLVLLLLISLRNSNLSVEKATI